MIVTETRPKGAFTIDRSGRSVDAAGSRGPVATEDPMLLARLPNIDVLVDVTGSVEYGAHVVLEAFRQGKDVVLMNAELDATIGPILQTHTDRRGVILPAARALTPACR